MKVRYFDGKTAQAHVASLSLKGEFLQIEIEQEKLIFSWPFIDLLLIEKPCHGRPVIVSSKKDSDARLILTEQQFFEINRNSKIMKRIVKNTPIFRTISLISIFLVLIFSCLICIPFFAKTLVSHIPLSMENFIAEKAAIEMGLTEKVLGTENQENILNKIIEHLKNSSNISQAIRIKIVDLGSANAFSLPNRIYVDKAILKEAQSEGEVIGIIAHEMGHILKKHSLVKIVEQLTITLLTRYVLDVDSNLSFLLENQYSQKLETEADNLAAEILFNAQVGTEGLQNFFARTVKSESENTILSILSTHPASIERLQLLKNLRQPKRIKQILSKEEWRELKK